MRRRVGLQEAEAGVARVARVGLRVADVVVRAGGEARLQLPEPVLEHREVDGDAEGAPQRLLVGDRPIRAAADEVAELLRRFDERNRDHAGRLAALERAVDVEADERTAHGSPAPGTSTRTRSMAPSRLSAIAG